jgi:hypothetical protein
MKGYLGNSNAFNVSSKELAFVKQLIQNSDQNSAFTPEDASWT